MRALLITAAALVAAVFLTTFNASAQITFTLNNVSFQSATLSAGSLSGTFTTNSSTLTSTTQLLSWDLIATATGPINGHSFAGFEYTNLDSRAYFNVGGSGLLTGFELDAPAGSTTANANDALRFYFATNLSATGSTSLSTVTPKISYENEQASGGNRSVVSGSVLAAVPEPSSWIMGCVAAGLFAGLCFRGRREGSVTHS
jgi:hypothetical protein